MAGDNAADTSAVANCISTSGGGTSGNGGNTGTTSAPEIKDPIIADPQIRDPSAGNTGTGDTGTRLQAEAAKTVASQPGIVVVTTSAGFTGALTSRLDGASQQAASDVGGAGGPMGLGMKKAPPRGQPITPSSPLSVYAMGTSAGGNREDSPDATGLNYSAAAGTVGLEYQASRNLIVGVAANLAKANANLNGNAGTADVEAVQAAIYLSYATKLWFADALLSYGQYDLDLTRSVQNQQLVGSTGGDVLALAARAGYLFDLGKFRVGPIAGLAFTRTRVDGYTETGNQQLAMTVSSQTVDSVVGHAGVRFLAPFVSDGRIVIPYLNLTVEHQLGADAHAINISLAAQGGGSPFVVAAPTFETRTYGKVEGGVTLHLSPNFSASLSGASSFARDEGQDYRVTSGFTFKF